MASAKSVQSVTSDAIQAAADNCTCARLTMTSSERDRCPFRKLPAQLCEKIFERCDAASAVRLAACSKSLRSVGVPSSSRWRVVRILSNCQAAELHQAKAEGGFYLVDYDTDDAGTDMGNRHFFHAYCSITVNSRCAREVVLKMRDVSIQDIIAGFGLTDLKFSTLLDGLCFLAAAAGRGEDYRLFGYDTPKIFFVIKLPLQDIVHTEDTEVWHVFFEKMVMALKRCFSLGCCQHPQFLGSIDRCYSGAGTDHFLERYRALCPRSQDTCYVDISARVVCRDASDTNVDASMEFVEFPPACGIPRQTRHVVFDKLLKSAYSAFLLNRHYLFCLERQKVETFLSSNHCG